jgi:hypothetical protein
MGMRGRGRGRSMRKRGDQQIGSHCFRGQWKRPLQQQAICKTPCGAPRQGGSASMRSLTSPLTRPEDFQAPAARWGRGGAASGGARGGVARHALRQRGAGLANRGSGSGGGRSPMVT